MLDLLMWTVAIYLAVTWAVGAAIILMTVCVVLVESILDGPKDPNLNRQARKLVLLGFFMPGALVYSVWKIIRRGE